MEDIRESWKEAERAFCANGDPLAGTDPKQDLERLFIVSITSAPLGPGPALQ